MPATANPSPQDPGADVAARERDEALWRTLLLLVEAGEVLPIVGRELLQGGEPPTHMYAWRAERVAKRLGVAFDPADPTKDPLNTLACRYLEYSGRHAPDLHRRLPQAQQLPTLGTPDPFRRLAGDRSFKLFVTTMRSTAASRQPSMPSASTGCRGPTCDRSPRSASGICPARSTLTVLTGSVSSAHLADRGLLS